MTPDYTTLLLAIGLSAMCLAATLFASWLSARVERFLLSWSIGIGLMVPAVASYAAYVEEPTVWLGCVSFMLHFSGFAFIYGAAYRYRTARSARRRIVGVFLGLCAATLPFVLSGFSGVAFIIFNVVLAASLFVTAREYWIAREEARLPITGIAILYVMMGLSFLLCAVVLLYERNWTLGGAPNNWAETLNLVMAIVGITGIGAMSLALNQWRVAGSHRRAAMTDALTGLLNRRALFDRYGDSGVGAHMAVIAFDLDNFKMINDRHGHAAGDAVLRAFAEVVNANAPESACIARLGGEEFALVLDRAPADRAAQVAERIRAAFAEQCIPNGNRVISCTVSAGIAFASDDVSSFDTLLNNADKALYLAKRDGRNRVSISSGLRLSA